MRGESLIRAVDRHSAALRHNLRARAPLAPDARVLAVIKANAYGHGLVPAARALAEADAFAVARLEEGLPLRAAGLDAARAAARGRVHTPTSSRRPQQHAST